jgi:hypothetical protein
LKASEARSLTLGVREIKKARTERGESNLAGYSVRRAGRRERVFIPAAAEGFVEGDQVGADGGLTQGE